MSWSKRHAEMRFSRRKQSTWATPKGTWEKGRHCSCTTNRLQAWDELEKIIHYFCHEVMKLVFTADDAGSMTIHTEQPLKMNLTWRDVAFGERWDVCFWAWSPRCAYGGRLMNSSYYQNIPEPASLSSKWFIGEVDQKNRTPAVKFMPHFLNKALDSH